MSDIVVALREAYGDNEGLCFEAADEIERLREVAGHYQCEYNLAAKRLAEAERLLHEAGVQI